MKRPLSRPLLGPAFIGCVLAACLLGLPPASAETGPATPGPAKTSMSARPGLPARAQTPLAGGSVLLQEDFEGSSVADPGFVPLQDACLTGATAPPPSGASTLPPCTVQPTPQNPVPPPGQLPGYLQLTDATNFRVGSVLYNRPLPGNGGLQVTFKQYQYGGTGADGIGFFLVNGSTDLSSAGADGGSLGYAQRNDVPGVSGGYLGVGLDAFGNFANDSENRGLLCTPPEVTPVPPHTTVPNAVSLRGPGQGLTGYCFLNGTVTPDPANPPNFKTTLPGTLRDAGALPGPSERTVRVTVSPDTLPLVTVEIDFEDGKGFQTVLTHQMTEPEPPTYKLGFSSSTGGATDVHLIRGVVATSLQTLDQLNLIKTVVDPGVTFSRVSNGVAQYSGTAYKPGDTVHYQFLVTNTGTETINNVVVNDPTVTDISCPRTTLGAAGTPTSSMVCTGLHVITPEESLSGKLQNTATAQGVGTNGTVTSNQSSAEVPVTPAPVHLVLAKTASRLNGRPGDKVGYTLVVTNHSGFTVDPATASDDLSDVLGGAASNNDVRASTGTATLTGTTLHWTGALADGQSATITYSVTIGRQHTLTNSVTSDNPGAVCSSGSPLPCRVSVSVGQAVVPPKPCKPEHKPGHKPGHKPEHKPGHKRGCKPGHK